MGRLRIILGIVLIIALMLPLGACVRPTHTIVNTHHGECGAIQRLHVRHRGGGRLHIQQRGNALYINGERISPSTE